MKKEFSDMLRELREKAGLSQEALARKANLSLSSVTKLEAGGMNPSWATVKALAAALGISCQAFEEDEAFTPEPKAKKPRKKRKESQP